MKILITGASQGLGAATVEAALSAGHRVTAFARHPERLAVSGSRLRRVAGDVRDPAAVRRAVSGQDAVIITLGLPTLRAMGIGRSRVLTAGTATIIDAMQQTGVKRLILETAIGTGESTRDLSLLARVALRGGLGYQFREKDRQEELVQASGLVWTIVRPTALTNGPATRRARIVPRVKAGGFTHVSRVDVATAMIGMLGEKRLLHQAVTVSYPNRPLTDWVGWLRHYR